MERPTVFGSAGRQMKFISNDELKSWNLQEAEEYCARLRGYLIDNVNRSGGHLASNLGIVEISVALSRVFNLPYDKVIYDVGHQSYIHKILSGRILSSENLRKYGGYSGFTKREESEFDPFGAGHSSTALSAAIGFSRASRILKADYYTIAVIGDGAFGGGMNLEALNNTSGCKKLIIILNDNEMSISKNVGGLAHYLNKMRSTNRYFHFKRSSAQFFSKIPLIGGRINTLLVKTKNTLKHAIYKDTLFRQVGISYLGPVDGNRLGDVERLLKEARYHSGPILVHLMTKKGKGYTPAESRPESYHSVSGGVQAKGEEKKYFSQVFAETLYQMACKNDKIVAITAAMVIGTGLERFKKDFSNRFFDVGIAEEHAMTFAGGLAAAGLLPVFAVYSTFFQRCYDQFLHDIVLQKLKVIISIDRAGIVGEDGPTHHGVFDVSICLNMPHVSVYSPATYDELRYCYAMAQEEPYTSVIRYPRGTEDAALCAAFPEACEYAVAGGEKSRVLFVTYGRIASSVLRARALLAQENISAAVLKFVKIKPVSLRALLPLIDRICPEVIFIAEEGMKIGGFGEYFISGLAEQGRSGWKTVHAAIDEAFVPHGAVEDLDRHCGFQPEQLAAAAKEALRYGE